MGLVYVEGFKLKHRQEIVSYWLRGLVLFMVVKFSLKFDFMKDLEDGTEPYLKILVAVEASTETRDWVHFCLTKERYQFDLKMKLFFRNVMLHQFLILYCSIDCTHFHSSIPKVK